MLLLLSHMLAAQLARHSTTWVLTNCLLVLSFQLIQLQFSLILNFKCISRMLNQCIGYLDGFHEISLHLLNVDIHFAEFFDWVIFDYPILSSSVHYTPNLKLFQKSLCFWFKEVYIGSQQAFHHGRTIAQVKSSREDFTLSIALYL